MRLDAVEKGHAVLGAVFMGHPATLPADDRDQRASFGGALIDETVHQGLHLAVKLLAADAVREWGGGDTWRRQRGHESVSSQDRPIARVDRIEPMASEARGFAAHVLEWHAGVKVVSHHALFDATFSLDPRLGL
jgi:hypothetical protein